MKPCIDLEHVGDLELFPDDFYAHAAYADGRMNRCKTCCKRRATAFELKRRAAREAAGLTRTPSPNERADRIAKARAEREMLEEREYFSDLEEVQTEVVLDQPEFRVESGFSSLTSLMPWLHQGRPALRHRRLG